MIAQLKCFVSGELCILKRKTFEQPFALFPGVTGCYSHRELVPKIGQEVETDQPDFSSEIEVAKLSTARNCSLEASYNFEPCSYIVWFSISLHFFFLVSIFGNF